MFKDKIDKGVQLFIPFKTTKPRDSQPWIDRKLKRKTHLRDRAFKKCKKCDSEDDEKKFQQLKHEVQREQSKAYWQFLLLWTIIFSLVVIRNFTNSSNIISRTIMALLC